MSRLLLLYIYVMWPGFVIGDFNGPVDITVKETDNARLTCSSQSGEPINSRAWWSDSDGIIASGGDLVTNTSKYSNFELVADFANGQYDLRINNTEHEDEGMYSCQIGAEDAKSAMLTVEAQITSVTLTVNGASGSSVDVMAGEEQTLVCTAVGARPRVGIDWTNGGASITGDTETYQDPNGHTCTPTCTCTCTTISTLLYTPTRNDNNHQFRCVTTGQQAATPQSQSVILNVQFAPVDVVVEHNTLTMTCSSAANPDVPDDQYTFSVDGKNTSTGKTFPYALEIHGCKTVTCAAINTIGTGTGSLAEPLCPVTHRCKGAPFDVGALVGGLVGGFAIGLVVAGCLFWKRRECRQICCSNL